MTIKNRFSKVLSSFYRITTSRQLIAITTFLLGFNACYNEPDILGGNLIPAGDKTSVQITDTFKVAAYTIQTDTLITSKYRDYLNNVDVNGSPLGVLGCYNDKLFGSIKSNFYTRIYQDAVKDSLIILKPRPTVDSAVLYLKLTRTWGEIKKSITVRVYQLSDSIIIKKTYNGLVNPEISYYPTQVNEPISYKGEEYLKIKFTSAFVDTLNADSSILASQVKFMKTMKGLYITTDNYTDPKGVLYSFSLTGDFKMYYERPNVSGDATRSFKLNISSLRFNHFQHDYTKADPALKIPVRLLSDIKDSTPQDTVFAIEGFGGVRGLIKLKGVKEWKKLMPIAIHRAELRFDIVNHNEWPSDSTIKELSFYSYRVFNYESQTVTDYPIYDEVRKSSYNKAKKYYSIDVTTHLQNLIKGKIDKDYIIVESVTNKSSIDPSLKKDVYMHGLYRTGNNSKPIKLIVTYSKL